LYIVVNWGRRRIGSRCILLLHFYTPFKATLPRSFSMKSTRF
jgi:hypothetical protein